ncbi:hypothetical protein ACGFWD_22100 [Streptomyces sp. NPDC048448]|uniref:hypothetical protein n=1 Tax=Streptomyces sp. NPDC048448 TaxID=3365554 RepID=UPI003722CBBC
MDIQPLLDALNLQGNAARAQADDLRTRIGQLQDRVREAEPHLEHLAITRKTVTALTDRIPTQAASPDLPEHPDYPRIFAVLNKATAPSEPVTPAKPSTHELVPKNIEGTRAKLKRLVKFDVLTEVDAGSFTRKQ